MSYSLHCERCCKTTPRANLTDLREILPEGEGFEVCLSCFGSYSEVEWVAWIEHQIGDEPATYQDELGFWRAYRRGEI